jgi:hypothetical protein
MPFGVLRARHPNRQLNAAVRRLEVWGVPDMGEWLVKALVVSFVVWVFWSFVQPQYVFVIRISRGQPSIRKGRVTRAFLQRVSAVCQEGGVVRGWIGGVQRGRRIALRFSRQFPPGPQQRLRNEWLLVD